MHRTLIRARTSRHIQASARLQCGLRARLGDRAFTVLALESSADDTCAAVVTSDRKILANVVIKQHSYHEAYGGIHPYVAIWAHQKNMPFAVSRALADANIAVTDVDGIAFTRGPGIGGCLSVCSNAAKTLAAALHKPVVGVHHMQAHALTPLLTSPRTELPEYPYLTLLVSGGHTLLLLARGLADFRILATVLGESAGHAIDKVARLLALQWAQVGPGAALEQFCAEADSEEAEDSDWDGSLPSLPSAMRGRLAFSFTGPHSTVERYLHSRGAAVGTREKRALARAFQRSVVGQLGEKLELALALCRQEGVRVRHVVVSGGVASNLFLRQRLRICLDNISPDEHVALVFPPPALCTDNAVMIGWAAMHRFLAGDTDDYSVALRVKWSIEELTRPSSGVPEDEGVKARHNMGLSR